MQCANELFSTKSSVPRNGFTYFHRNFRYIVRLVRHDQSKVVHHSNTLMARRAMFYDPNGTADNCIGCLAVVPNTNMSGTKIPIQFHKPIDRLAPMSLAILCPCSNGGQHIVRLFHRAHQCVALGRCVHFYMPALVLSINFRNNPFLVHQPIVQIDLVFVDRNRSAHISCYCNHIRLNGIQIVSVVWQTKMQKIFMWKNESKFGIFGLSKIKRTNLIQTGRQACLFCAGVNQRIVSTADNFIRYAFEGPWSHAYVFTAQL